MTVSVLAALTASTPSRCGFLLQSIAMIHRHVSLLFGPAPFQVVQATDQANVMSGINVVARALPVHLVNVNYLKVIGTTLYHRLCILIGSIPLTIERRISADPGSANVLFWRFTGDVFFNSTLKQKQKVFKDLGPSSPGPLSGMAPIRRAELGSSSDLMSCAGVGMIGPWIGVFVRVRQEFEGLLLDTFDGPYDV